MTLELHPLAEMFPAMDPDRLQELADDIKKDGQLLPIVLLEGKILDGRSRYVAARMAGREPITVDFNAAEYNGSPLDYVAAMNIQRRDLTPSQRAAIAADLADKLREEAAAAPLSHRAAPLSRERAKQAAETLNVSERAVYDANRLRNEDPAGFKQVKKGKKTLGQATHRPARAKAKLSVPKKYSPQVYWMLSHKLGNLAATWIAQYGSRRVDKVLSAQVDTWRVTITPIPRER